MTVLEKLSPQDVAKRLEAGTIALIDVREADEHRREQIEDALSVPLSSLDKADLSLAAGRPAVFHCKSGMRTQSQCARLSSLVSGEAYIMEGGLDGWKSAGLPTTKQANAPLEIMRQVQITAGSLVLAGVLLGWFVDPRFYGLSAFVGAGLTFAGISGWCGMANLLSIMPWNRMPRSA